MQQRTEEHWNWAEAEQPQQNGRTVRDPRNDSWNEQQAMTSTADYISQFDNTSGNSDLELAIALQQQEFEQQPQIQQQSTPSGRPGLVVGPRVRFLCSIITIVYSYRHQNLISYYHLRLSALSLGLF